ncbi:MAG: PqiC family protein [Deltaproteobacteria bacterium]|nr:PqiC family protein [Deltaproteobacteria bacterium]
MNTKTTAFLSIILACGLICTLVGCFQAKPVRLYTLTTEPPLQALPQKAASTTILIGPVKLASYLDQPRMVRRHSITQIDSIAGHQWAGNLAEMISDKLVAEMGALLQPSPVFAYPATTVFTRGRRVALDILRFEGTEDKTATIEARWTLFDLTDKSILKTQSSLIHTPLTDDSYEALATALSQGLTTISREIAEAIRSEKSE